MNFVLGVLASGVGYGLVALLMGRDRGLWERQAHKLATKSGVALPSQLTPVVARFLRGRHLVQTSAIPVIIGLQYVFPGPHELARALPRLIAAAPVLIVGISYALTGRPRWKGTGVPSVGHARRVPVRQAFTQAEVVSLCIGVVVTCVCAGWGLREASAPAWWWIMCAAGIAAGFAVWRLASSAIMNRPSRASDVIELGWDDVFRFQRVRGVAGVAAWGLALWFYLTDWELAPAIGSNLRSILIPPLLVLAALLAVCAVFREGRRLWRRAWTEYDQARP
jgi:hypothetical protein